MLYEQEPVEDPAVEAQGDGGVLDAKQRTKIRLEAQVCMWHVELCDLHTEEERGEEGRRIIGKLYT